MTAPLTCSSPAALQVMFDAAQKCAIGMKCKTQRGIDNDAHRAFGAIALGKPNIL